jgi:hypothetical protein
MSALLVLTGCGANPDSGNGAEDDFVADRSGSLATRVRVSGRVVDVESDYLPKVVMCENPDAPYEALKAQAIASRSFLFFRTQGSSTPSIRNGQADQVYTCPANRNGALVTAAVRQAVADTRGMYMTYNGRIITSNFVSGANRDSQCRRGSDPTGTEPYVTVNVNRSGTSVVGTSMESRGDPDNRGCLGQLLANCLASVNGLDAAALLQYFYGADVVVHGLTDVAADPAGVPTGAAAAPAGAGAGSGAGPTAGPTTCHSDTLPADVALGACVQSKFDNVWYQCMADGSWATGGDNGQGPGGTCSSWTPLPM